MKRGSFQFQFQSWGLLFYGRMTRLMHFNGVFFFFLHLFKAVAFIPTPLPSRPIPTFSISYVHVLIPSFQPSPPHNYFSLTSALREDDESF